MTTRLLTAIANATWAILPSALETMVDAARHNVQPEAAVRQASRPGAIAVIPISGPITQKGGGLFEMFFGGTSTERLSQELRQAMADDSVKAVVFDIDSPGGQTNGIQEFADEVYRARGRKPIVAVANSVAASAAYWIGSQADEFIAAPSAMVGSIGVFAMHEDISAMAEKLGVKVTLISAGKHKTDGNKFEPLSDEARASMQKLVDDNYADFVGAVARGRGVKATDVRNGYGQGRVVGAKEAVAGGMADRVGTFGDALVQARTFALTASAPSKVTVLSADENTTTYTWADNALPIDAEQVAEMNRLAAEIKRVEAETAVLKAKAIANRERAYVRAAWGLEIAEIAERVLDNTPEPAVT